MYKLKNIKCKYSTSIRPILEIDELEIKENEVVFFVGPSGVGKSTILETLGLMNDTVEVDNDSVFELNIGGINIDMRNVWKEKESTLSDIRNDFFSFIFQENNLFQSLSGMQNAIASSIIKGVSSEDAFKKANKVRKQLLSDINLNEETQDFNINGISGGQRQRLSFIRAIITKYNVLFADEPTGNLDWLNAEILMKFLIDNMNENSSAIIVSHDIDLSLKFADKIVYLEKKSEIINGKPYYYGKIDNSTVFYNTDKENMLWENSKNNFSRKELKKLIKDRFRVAQGEEITVKKKVLIENNY
jgi:putative ABC transport system permease protein